MKIYDANGKSVLDVDVDDTSYRHREVMGEDTLVLKFSSATHVEIPVGATCTFRGETYTLARPEALTMRHSRDFEYTVTMQGPQYKAGMWKFRNPDDGRVKFSLTAKPSEHLQMFVDNMNDREGGWSAGECVDHDEVCVCYDHAYCIDALSQMAEAFGTEWEIDGANRVVHLRRVEYYKDAPLELSYGRGNGLKPDVGRSNSSDTPPVEVLYAQGGGDNIDAGKYPQDIHGSGGDGTGTGQNTHSSVLLLPPGRKIGYDGETFFYEGDSGWDGSDVRHYVVDEKGYSVRRSDKDLDTKAEDSLDCSEIYPKRVGEVVAVDPIDEENNFYDIIDTTIEFDYSECLIEGETMTIIFQSGELAGREFDVNYIHSERRFEIVPEDIDGITMPGGSFVPKEGDKYAVFNCMLPNSYICQDSDHSGAEWDMLRECVRYFYDNEEQKFTFTGKMDGIWSKNDWDNIGAKIIPGGHILFSDERFQPEGEVVRIVGVKDYVNSPQSPELELSNETVTPGFASTVKEIESREMLVEERYRSSLQFTKRRFRDAQETLTLLEQTVNSLSGEFTEGVSPVSVQTMTMLVGDDALQFRFVEGFGSTEVALHSVTWDAVLGVLSVGSGYLQHLTIGVTTVTNSDGRQTQEYRTWYMPSADLTPSDTGARWVYAVVPQSDSATPEGYFRMTAEAMDMDDGAGNWWLLLGILNSEYEGDRSFAQMYGFTEVSPGRITTGRIVSGDGTTYFDLDTGEIVGRIVFKDGLIAGVIGIGGGESEVNAGMSSDGKEDGSVRIWAGATVANRDTAPFRVTHDGSLYATRGVFSGFLQVAFASLPDVGTKEISGDAYILGLEWCNLLLPLTTTGYTVRLPYSADNPSLYSGVVYNFFFYYHLNEIFDDSLKVDANGGYIWYYDDTVDANAIHLSNIKFYGGYVQLICIGSNQWIISINSARETEPGDRITDVDIITLSPTSATFEYSGGTQSVSLTSEVDWKVQSCPDWVEVQPSSGNGGTSTVTVTAARNGTGIRRTGDVIFTNGNATMASLPITQQSTPAQRTLTINVSVPAGFTAIPKIKVTVEGTSTTYTCTKVDDTHYTWSGEFDDGSFVAYTVSATGAASTSGSVTMSQDRTVTVTLRTEATSYKG